MSSGELCPMCHEPVNHIGDKHYCFGCCSEIEKKEEKEDECKKRDL
jgi:predicted amidophosphoribosyltransferase